MNRRKFFNTTVSSVAASILPFNVLSSNAGSSGKCLISEWIGCYDITDIHGFGGTRI